MRSIQDRRLVWWMLAALMIEVQIADVVTTARAWRRGGVEINPLGAWLIAHGFWSYLAGLKLLVGVALAVALLAYAMRPATRRSWQGAVVLLLASLLTIGYGLIIGGNLGLWPPLTAALWAFFAR